MVLSLALGLFGGCRSKAPPTDESAQADAAEGDQDKAATPARPSVVIETDQGAITVGLLADKAPETVKNFLAYVQQRHYDNTVFHKVVRHLLIKGGGYGIDLREKSTAFPPVRNESANGLKNRRGTVAVDRDFSRPDSGRCQFFINVADNPNLDGDPRRGEPGYCVFGEVTAGIEVVDQIAQSEVKDRPDLDLDEIPVRAIIIKSIRVVR